MSKKTFGHSWALLVLISSPCSMITMADWRRNELKVKSAVLKNRKRTCTRQILLACSPRILRNWHQRSRLYYWTRNAGLKEVTIFLLFSLPPFCFICIEFFSRSPHCWQSIFLLKSGRYSVVRGKTHPILPLTFAFTHFYPKRERLAATVCSSITSRSRPRPTFHDIMYMYAKGGNLLVDSFL